MARQLGDVLHYFMPELEHARAADGPRPAPPTLVVPVASDDVVRAALLWNLAAELARSGPAPPVLVTPDPLSPPLWPSPGRGPLGLAVEHTSAKSLAELGHAVAISRERGRGRTAGSPALVAVPSPWLREADRGGAWIDRLLVLTRPDDRELLHAYAAMKRVAHARPEATLGATIFGVERIDAAKHAFETLAGTVEAHLGRALTSYGVLVDDLDLCRSLVTARPVVLSQPQSPAARALVDVARLVREDLSPVESAGA